MLAIRALPAVPVQSVLLVLSNQVWEPEFVLHAVYQVLLSQLRQNYAGAMQDTIVVQTAARAPLAQLILTSPP